MKFIYLCAGILVFSFTALPALFGISAERDQIVNVAAIEPAAGNEAMSFDEIYALADQSVALNDPSMFDPAMLNAIEPAAGPAETETGFTSGFNRDNYPAF